MSDPARTRPVVLCVVEGYGERAETESNGWREAKTPAIDALRARFPSTLLDASGPAVGLGVGAPGNGQVGFQALGTGRVPRPSVARIDECIAQRKLGALPIVAQTLRIACDRKSRLHLLGLLSEGRSHSSLDHLYSLLDLADFHEVPVVLHAVLDGRDSGPRSAATLFDRIAVRLEGRGVVGTVCGRHWAMETGEQWDRTYRAFHAIVRDKVLGPEAPRAETPFDALQLAYQQGLDDDFVPPTRIGDYEGLRGDFLCDFAAPKPVWEWTGEEVALCWNHRPDGLRSLVAMLTRRGLPEEVVVDLLTDRNKPVLAFDEHCFATLTEVDPSFHLPVAFAPDERLESCGDVVARAGLRQLRIAEEPKLGHVTEFFDGGRVEPRAGERRVALPLPMDADRFCERPALRTDEIARQTCAALEQGTADFVVASFGAAEIVGKERVRGALHEAVRHIDRAVGQIAEVALARDGAVVLCSDHGCCEALVDAEGRPSAKHTTNRVPCVLVSAANLGRALRPGSLVDVAPTLLELLGLPVPAAMTGHSLLAAPK